MILVDYSGICLASILINKTLDEGMIRHMTLNSLRMYNKKFRDDYGQMILACDGANNWRREYFPQYKANRRTGREESTFDWNEAFRILHTIQNEIKENFPYKVIHLEGCEADDIIGTLVEHTQEFGNYEDVMIVSSDGDFKQLQRYDNVKQFSPMFKKFVVDDNPRVNLLDKILKGDSGDGVPNVLSDDDVLVEGRRQTPLSKKKKDTIIEDLAEGELLYAASWYRNYCRNEKLIDLTKTPDDLKKNIINSYEEQDPWNNKGKVFPYLVAKRMNRLIESVQEFI
jgi:hypothetical protein